MGNFPTKLSGTKMDSNSNSSSSSDHRRSLKDFNHKALKLIPSPLSSSSSKFVLMQAVSTNTPKIPSRQQSRSRSASRVSSYLKRIEQENNENKIPELNIRNPSRSRSIIKKAQQWENKNQANSNETSNYSTLPWRTKFKGGSSTIANVTPSEPVIKTSNKVKKTQSSPDLFSSVVEKQTLQEVVDKKRSKHDKMIEGSSSITVAVRPHSIIYEEQEDQTENFLQSNESLHNDSSSHKDKKDISTTTPNANKNETIEISELNDGSYGSSIQTSPILSFPNTPPPSTELTSSIIKDRDCDNIEEMKEVEEEEDDAEKSNVIRARDLNEDDSGNGESQSRSREMSPTTMTRRFSRESVPEREVDDDDAHLAHFRTTFRKSHSCKDVIEDNNTPGVASEDSRTSSIEDLASSMENLKEKLSCHSKILHSNSNPSINRFLSRSHSWHNNFSGSSTGLKHYQSRSSSFSWKRYNSNTDDDDVPAPPTSAPPSAPPNKQNISDPRLSSTTFHNNNSNSSPSECSSQQYRLFESAPKNHNDGNRSSNITNSKNLKLKSVGEGGGVVLDNHSQFKEGYREWSPSSSSSSSEEEEDSEGVSYECVVTCSTNIQTNNLDRNQDLESFKSSFLQSMGTLNNPTTLSNDYEEEEEEEKGVQCEEAAKLNAELMRKQNPNRINKTASQYFYRRQYLSIIQEEEELDSSITPTTSRPTSMYNNYTTSSRPLYESSCESTVNYYGGSQASLDSLASINSILSEEGSLGANNSEISSSSNNKVTSKSLSHILEFVSPPSCTPDSSSVQSSSNTTDEMKASNNDFINPLESPSRTKSSSSSSSSSSVDESVSSIISECTQYIKYQQNELGGSMQSMFLNDEDDKQEDPLLPLPSPSSIVLSKFPPLNQRESVYENIDDYESYYKFNSQKVNCTNEKIDWRERKALPLPPVSSLFHFDENESCLYASVIDKTCTSNYDSDFYDSILSEYEESTLNSRCTTPSVVKSSNSALFNIYKSNCLEGKLTTYKENDNDITPILSVFDDLNEYLSDASNEMSLDYRLAKMRKRTKNKIEETKSVDRGRILPPRRSDSMERMKKFYSLPRSCNFELQRSHTDSRLNENYKSMTNDEDKGYNSLSLKRRKAIKAASFQSLIH